MVEIKYYGELGYMCIYILPIYEKYKFTENCIIHTYEDYADILMRYRKDNIEFVKYPFISKYRCCADSDDTDKKINLANYLGANCPIGMTHLINKLNKCLGNDNGNNRNRILLFPRMRRSCDYGGFDKSLYTNIIKKYSNKKEIILIGHKSETYDMTEYMLKHMELNEVMDACRTAYMCITPDSGMASLLIASGVKKIIVIINEKYINDNKKYFHKEIYKTTSKWFNTDCLVMDSSKVIEYLENNNDKVNSTIVTIYKNPQPNTKSIIGVQKSIIANINNMESKNIKI